MGFLLPILSRRRVSVHNDCPVERGCLPPSSRVPGVCPGGWVVNDEIDSRINAGTLHESRGALSEMQGDLRETRGVLCKSMQGTLYSHKTIDKT